MSQLIRLSLALALSVGLGFETASALSGLGAGGISGYPRLIIDMPKLFAKRIHIAVNGGAVIAGTTRPCTAVELEQQANMPSMTNTTPGTGTMMDVPAPACEKRSLGLGNHFLYGAGISANVSSDQGIYLTTELLGSVSIGLEETRTPQFWDIGIRRAKANATFFSAAYGIAQSRGWVALLAAVIMAILAVVGFIHGHRVSKDALVGAPDAKPTVAAG